MKRKFISNLALLLFLNLLVKPVYAFGIDVGVQNAVGAEHYGSYFILLNFSLIFQILLDLGFENFSRREIARHQHLVTKYFSRILPMKLLLGLLYFGFCSLAGMMMGWHGAEFKLLLIMLLNQFLASFILYLRANLGGMHHFKADSILSVIDKTIVILICGILLLHPFTRHVFRIEWLIYSQTFAYLLTALLAFVIVYLKARPLHFSFDMRYYRLFLRQTLPYALLILLMSAYTRADSVLLGKLLDNGKEQAGIYAQSFRIIEILSNYGYLFTLILLPVFSRMIRQGEPVGHLVKLSVTLLFVPAIMVTIGCFSFRHEIIDVLYHQHAASSAKVFGIIIFSFLGLCSTYIFGTLLTANGNLTQLNIMAAMAVVLNLGLNLILIRKHGVFGAAIANLATQIFTSAYQFILAWRIFRFRSDYRWLTRLVIFILLSILCVKLTGYLELKWLYALGLYLICTLLLSMATGLISLKSLLKMMIALK